MKKNIAIIIAGGVGARMGNDIPKQFINVYDKPVIMYTLEKFQNHPNIDGIIVVCIDGWEGILSSYAKQYKISKLVSIVKGGKCGQESIKNGLLEAKKLYKTKDTMVLIHDAIRPMVSEDIISDCIVKCNQYGNAISAAVCTTVVLKKDDELSSKEVVDRDQIVLTQTPQAFKLDDILATHKEAEKRGIFNSVASCSLYVELGKKVFFALGDETNIKLTRPSDLLIFKALLSVKKEEWMK